MMSVSPVGERDSLDHGRAVIARALEPLPAPSQATIDMVRGLKGPPLRRVEPEREKELSAATRAALLQAAIVGESRIRRLWWLSLGMLPRITSWRDGPREMPKDEAFATPVRS